MSLVAQSKSGMANPKILVLVIVFPMLTLFFHADHVRTKA
jgi:hypothetical protein